MAKNRYLFLDVDGTLSPYNLGSISGFKVDDLPKPWRGEYLEQTHTGRISNSLLVVVPSDNRYKQQMNLTFYKPFGAKAMTLDKFAQQIADIAPRADFTNEGLLYRLNRLVN